MKSSLSRAVEESRLLKIETQDKEKALKMLCESLESSLSYPKEANLLQKVLQRESLLVTYLGFSVACPHARLEDGEEIICEIGWSPVGLDYGVKNNEKVHFVFLYVIPEKLRNDYLNEMAALAKTINGDEQKQKICEIKSIEEARAKLLEWAEKVNKRKEELSSNQAAPGSSAKLHPEAVNEPIKDGKLNEIKALFTTLDAADIADMLHETEAQHSILLFKLIPRALAGEVFSLLEYDIQNELIMKMANDETKQLISSLPPDDRTALFEELPANVTQRLLTLLSDKERKEALKLLSYPENSVGRLMTNKYVTVKPDWTAGQAIEHIRKTGSDSETIAMVYTTDEKGVLTDDLKLRKIIIADISAKISEMLDGRYAALYSYQDREEAVNMFKKYDLFALPVIDKDGILLGIVTSDDILDVSEEEATEDFHKTVAVRPLEDDYLNASVALIYRSRIPWLVTLVFIVVLAGASMAWFEELIASHIHLVFFLPLLIGGAGNAGTQAATLVIRSMALGEVKVSDIIKVGGRELFVSLCLGFTMAAVVFFLAWWRSGLSIAYVVSAAMVVVVAMGSMIGMLLPFIFKKVKIDPAVASGPLVTSFVDIAGIVIYFSIASLLLKS